MDEAKLISRQIAETRVEIAVCTRLKNNGVMMRLGKPVGDLLVAYEMKLVDLENQLQALARKPAPKPVAPATVTPAAKPALQARPITPVAAKPAAPVATKAATPAASKAPTPAPTKAATPAAVKRAPAKPAPAKAVAAKSAALEPKAAPTRKAAPAKSRK